VAWCRWGVSALVCPLVGLCLSPVSGWVGGLVGGGSDVVFHLVALVELSAVCFLGGAGSQRTLWCGLAVSRIGLLAL
jgi:hypothetical protein